MTTYASAPAPDESFAEYNTGKLEVRNGLVHLLPNGWVEYGPLFAGANVMLRDQMPLAEFKLGVRAGARASLAANDAALRAELAKLETPLEDKRFIRELLVPAGSPVSPQAGQVIAFPSRAPG